jgi:hypothetical protein
MSRWRCCRSNAGAGHDTTPESSDVGGALVAFVLALAGAAVFAATTPWLSTAHAIRGIAIALGGAYTLYLLSRSEERTGRIATVALWCVATALAVVFASSLPLFLICQVASIWLIRSLYFHGSIVAALADLGLGGLALAFAIWAARTAASCSRSGVSSWCRRCLSRCPPTSP